MQRQGTLHRPAQKNSTSLGASSIPDLLTFRASSPTKWHHFHRLALPTPLHSRHLRPTTSWSQARILGSPHRSARSTSSTSSTCTLRCVLECSFSTLFRHYIGPGTSNTTGCGTRAIITPASVTTPMSRTSDAETFWTWDGPMSTTLSPSTYGSL